MLHIIITSNNRFILHTMITNNGCFILNFVKKTTIPVCFLSVVGHKNINNRIDHVCCVFFVIICQKITIWGLWSISKYKNLLRCTTLKINCNHANGLMTIGRCVLTRRGHGRIHVLVVFISRQHQMNPSTYVNMEVHSAKWGKERMTHVASELPYRGQRPRDNTSYLCPP